jgi:LysM repeat protein
MHPKRKPSPACQHTTEVPSLPMTRLLRTLAILLFSVSLAIHTDAQSPSPAAGGSEAAQLLSLTRKIDEQNIKIDALSQQILRLQQEIQHPRGTSLGSPLPVGGETSSPAAAATAAADGSTHVVARGETLTSIAKMHKVGIDELQKFNHIENDRKLQIGQTLVIPGAQATAPSPSPNASVPNG